MRGIGGERVPGSELESRSLHHRLYLYIFYHFVSFGLQTHEFMSPNETSTTDKQSLNFIVRSGLAGGVAGCVVSTMFRYFPLC